MVRQISTAPPRLLWRVACPRLNHNTRRASATFLPAFLRATRKDSRELLRSHLFPVRTSSSVGRSTREGAVGDPVAKQKLSPAVRSAASLEQTYTVTFLPAHSLTLHLLSLGPLSPTPIFFNRSGHYLSPLYLLSLYNAQENLKNLSEKKLDMVMYAMHEGQESAV